MRAKIIDDCFNSIIGLLILINNQNESRFKIKNPPVLAEGFSYELIDFPNLNMLLKRHCILPSANA